MKKTNFIFILILLSLLNSISCKEKDDKDYIISFIRIAKEKDIKRLERLISSKYKEEEKIIYHASMLIDDMQINEIPNKDEIKQIITTPEYPGYTFLLQPNNIEYMISLDKTKKPIQILHITRIGKVTPNKKLEFAD